MRYMWQKQNIIVWYLIEITFNMVLVGVKFRNVKIFKNVFIGNLIRMTYLELPTLFDNML